MNVIRAYYGPDSLQFGELRLPEGEGEFPVIVIIHGGCWLNAYDYTLMNDMAEDLVNRGYATWNLEYRRLGDEGGGWPGTFHDVVSGLAYLSKLSSQYPIQMQRVLVTGHSAGGHLALWLGGYANLEESDELYQGVVPDIAGIVSLAGITDLASYRSPGGCGASVDQLVGGNPAEFPDRLAIASPIERLEGMPPVIMINGDKDNIVPVAHVSPYFDRSKERGNEIDLITFPDAGHFEVITPGSIAWEAICEAFEKLRAQ